MLLKALSGRLRTQGNAKYSGEVYYDGDNIKSGKFLIPKVSDYIEQGDILEAALTVDETFKFSWNCTTGGAHGYASAKDDGSHKIMSEEDEHFTHVQNTIMLLGLTSCKDVYVGNDMLRGISGGQKRRTTIGEKLVCPRPVKFCDCITNGLDSATSFDIIRTIKVMVSKLSSTSVISLLQVTS